MTSFDTLPLEYADVEAKALKIGGGRRPVDGLDCIACGADIPGTAYYQRPDDPRSQRANWKGGHPTMCASCAQRVQ
jgi:hypothetical protein